MQNHLARGKNSAKNEAEANKVVLPQRDPGWPFCVGQIADDEIYGLGDGETKMSCPGSSGVPSMVVAA